MGYTLVWLGRDTLNAISILTRVIGETSASFIPVSCRIELTATGFFTHWQTEALRYHHTSIIEVIIHYPSSGRLLTRRSRRLIRTPRYTPTRRSPCADHYSPEHKMKSYHLHLQDSGSRFQAPYPQNSLPRKMPVSPP